MLALRRGIFPGNPGGPSGGRPVFFTRICPKSSGLGPEDALAEGEPDLGLRMALAPEHRQPYRVKWDTPFFFLARAFARARALPRARIASGSGSAISIDSPTTRAYKPPPIIQDPKESRPHAVLRGRISLRR